MKKIKGGKKENHIFCFDSSKTISKNSKIDSNKRDFRAFENLGFLNNMMAEFQISSLEFSITRSIRASFFITSGQICTIQNIFETNFEVIK